MNRFLGLVLVTLAGSASIAQAGIVFQSGVLHIEGNTWRTGTVSPPDLVMSSGAPVTHVGTASYPPNPGPTGLALVGGGGIVASVQNDHLSLNSSLLAHSAEPGFPPSTVSASSAATITFLQTTPSDLELDLDLTSDTAAGNGTVTVRDAANSVVMTFTGAGSTATPSAPVTAFFAPGLYTVSFAHANSATTPGVDSDMLFDIVAVPEPAAATSLLLPLLFLRRAADAQRLQSRPCSSTKQKST